MPGLPTVGRIPTLVLLCSLGLFSTSGCKAKLDKGNTDGGAPSSSAASTPSTGEAKRAVNRYLTANVTRGFWSRNEKLLAFDAVQGALKIGRVKGELQVHGKATVFVRTAGGKDNKGVGQFGCALKRDRGQWIATACHLGGFEVFRRKPQTVDTTTVGEPTCDRLIRFLRCLSSKMSTKQRGGLGNTFDNSITAYRRALQNPSTRASTLKTCGQALKAIRKNIGKIPKFKACLEGD